eukprot:362451-Chlamydomonas_euryale.AAC.1
MDAPAASSSPAAHSAASSCTPSAASDACPRAVVVKPYTTDIATKASAAHAPKLGAATGSAGAVAGGAAGAAAASPPSIDPSMDPSTEARLCSVPGSAEPGAGEASAGGVDT